MSKAHILALRDVIVIFIGAVIGGFTLNFVASEFTPAQIITGLAMIALAYAIYTLYTIRVNQYKYQEKLNKMVDELHK